MAKSHIRAFAAAISVALGLTISLPTTGKSEGISPPRPEPHHFVLNLASIQMAARVLGYVTAQNAALDYIANTYPQSAARALGLKQSFAAKFGFPDQRARWFLEDAYNAAEAQDLLDELEAQAVAQANGMIAEKADLMLKEMALRISGEVSEPELQTMLWLKYASKPDEEMRLWQKTYNSAGHPKSQDLEVQLNVPLSWRHEEGDRPHVVSKWTSQYGAGDMVIILLVKDYNGGFTHEEAQQIERDKDWDWVIPNGFTALGGQAVVVDRQPAVSVDSQGVRAALDVDIMQSVRNYLIFPEAKMINLSCMLGSLPDGDEMVRSERFEKLKRVCRQVALSVTFPNTYR